MKPIENSSYQVFFDNSLQSVHQILSKKKYSKIFVLTDEMTGQYCLPVFQEKLPELTDFDLIEVPNGEENKTIDFCIGIWQMLLEFEADRNAILINLGGGVVTDMGGFAASTFKRGIDFIQIPTTLLSQVDASVGGKTGVDLSDVKNIIGTFTQPEAVIIATDFLKTLDERQMTSGFAEVIKHGIIANADFFKEITALENANEITEKQIYHSIGIKNKVVLEDPFEKGLRKTLNFGHTIGHAIESWSLKNDKNSLLHGEAIALGMICEAYLAKEIIGLPESDLELITSSFLKFFGKYKIRQGIEQELLEIMKNDKKNVSGKIGFSLPDKLGNCLFDIFVEENLIKKSLNYYRSLEL
ncbi:MAG: 3-dehydroquinate synthase [Bacteroidetes bacterium]|nr:3-dehydroquinate synthase [Bacteroidota bacterium]MBU1372170.1 3-dehydroquinate synthase [Bacteroidota bacterium]MBU1483352.1 3-dehydroquinate synthase [Bacteroidota bacterium]MBU1759570.1 3-dehydroquinate synthase [Bacteroidota bacterium]MBU2267032.1 3-dehydroquinate synthase [Bacteroidota bacterium]